MGWACSINGAKRNVYRLLVGKPEGKRPRGRPRRRGLDNIKVHLREIGWDGMDWIDLPRLRDLCRALLNTVMNQRVPQNIGKFLNSCTADAFSRRAEQITSVCDLRITAPKPLTVF
jgi:hypothetical protein